MRYTVRQIPCGNIRGLDTQKGYALYKNIPYAHAERWEKPVEVTAWGGSTMLLPPLPGASRQVLLPQKKVAMPAFMPVKISSSR